MDAIRNFWTMHFSWLQLPTLSIRWTDILEIIILSFFIYHFLIWVRRTRTWVLLKGLLVLVFFVSLAYIFEMDTIKFLITRGMDVAMVAAVIVFQPELRRALEQLGGLVLDCDAIYHELLRTDGALRGAIAGAFGPVTRSI
mgnify:CR=1 FL=1